MNFADRIPHYRERVQQTLERWLPAETLAPERLHAAMRYAALGGGKRLRPVLVYATGEALGIPEQRLDGAAASVELIHAYSLVHDDLPAMDDDDLRRGQPTCHKAFDEATAILVGDGLQTLAFQVLAQDPSLEAEAAQRLDMITVLAEASGSRGMVGGQALDLAAEGHKLALPDLETLHRHKTGALIRACVLMAAALGADVPEKVQVGLDRYAQCIGLAFQIQDDILDIEGSTEVLGKTQGADQAHDKATFPSLMGLEASRTRARALVAEAAENLKGLPGDGEALRWLANYIIERGY